MVTIMNGGNYMNEDTINLLRESIVGCKMGINTLDAVLPKVDNDKLREFLETMLRKNTEIMVDMSICLYRKNEESKEPMKMAREMAKFTIDMKTRCEDADKKIISIVVDGCNMGIKKLEENILECETAEKCASDNVRKLIALLQECKDRLNNREYLN